jgi:hypothetical protein
MSDVKRISTIFAYAALAGFALILVSSGWHGYAEVVAQSSGIALFTAGLIAFPLAILGHGELTNAAKSHLRHMQEASADKILEERLSKAHIRTLRDETFGKPILEHLRFLITFHQPSVSPADGEPCLPLEFDREYSATNYEAAPVLLDVLHHVTGPPSLPAADEGTGFTYLCLELGEEGDRLEWDPDADSMWEQSGDGHFVTKWNGCEASLGREPGVDNLFTLRLQGLRIDPGITLRAKVISETQVSLIGAEPFGVNLPATDLQITVRSTSVTAAALYPFYAPFRPFIPASRMMGHGDRMQEITWRWNRALFPGQGVLLRWRPVPRSHRQA